MSQTISTGFCHKYLFEEFCAVSGGLTDISDKKSNSYNLLKDNTALHQTLWHATAYYTS